MGLPDFTKLTPRGALRLLTRAAGDLLNLERARDDGSYGKTYLVYFEGYSVGFAEARFVAMKKLAEALENAGFEYVTRKDSDLKDKWT